MLRRVGSQLRRIGQSYTLLFIRNKSTWPELENSAKEGCIRSMAKLGQHLMDDERVEEAEKWLEAAAESGDEDSQFHLALILHRRASQADEEGNSDENEEKSSEETAQDVLKVIEDAKKRARKARKAKLRELSASAQSNRRKSAEKGPAELAEFWTRRAVSGGHIKAMTLLGNMLLDRADDTGEHMEGFLWQQRAAKASPPDADACYNLGLLFYEGRTSAGVPRDLHMSFQYFKKGAELGDLGSTFWVGYCYATGESEVPVRPSTALTYLERAALEGHGSANFYMAMLFREGTVASEGLAEESLGADTERFEAYLRKAVEEDEDPDALFCLADMQMHGLDGRERSVLRAVELYTLASTLGHVDATVCLGAIHYHGLGGYPRDARRAFELYNIAAEGGSSEAWRNLAAMYASGDGVPQSKEMAISIMKTVFPDEEHDLE